MRLFLASALVLASVRAFAAPEPVARYTAGSSGFIDDGYVLRDDGKALAFVTTNGATAAILHLADVGGTDVAIAGAPFDANSVYWLGPGRVLVVSGAGPVNAQLFTAKGPAATKIGPFDRMAMGTVDGKRAIITYTRTEKHGVDYSLAAYAVDTLRPFKRHTWHEDAEGQIKQGSSSVKLLWWNDGYTVLAAMRAGEYDKKRDVRRPDRFTRIDAFSGRVIEEREIEDVLGFTHVSLLRRELPNLTAVVHFSEDRKKLMFTDGTSEHELTLPVELAKYDATTLSFQTIDDHHVVFSLTVDPVNAQAVKRQKADVDQVELYDLDRQTRKATLLLQLPGEGRRVSWQIAGHRLLLLRRSKGFDRGGVGLELYDLPGTPTAH